MFPLPTPCKRLRMSMRIATLLLLPAVFGPVGEVSALGDETPRYTLTQTADETVVRIAAVDEQILSDDLLTALSAVADLDAQTLVRKLPEGDFDLSTKRTRVTLLVVEKALRGRADLAIEKDASGVAQALIVAIDRAELETDRRQWKQTSRKWIGAIGTVTGHSIQELSWGLRGFEITPLQPGQPLVVLIHGLQGSHHSVEGLRQELTRAGHACVTYAYPNDGPLIDSARRLASDLKAVELPADSTLILVTHSMGGLVARRMIEDPDLDDSRVRQLLMIVPPNSGSNLAYLPASLDWHEHLHDRSIDGLPEFIFRSTSDGHNEAQADLRPHSRFLLDLNTRERNPRVRYSILLGTRSPATQAQLDAVSRKLDRLTDKSDTVQLFAPRLRKIFDHPLELTPGEGDGAVAVERGRLAGVEDVVLLPMDHWTATHGLGAPDGQELLHEVLNRLLSGSVHGPPPKDGDTVR